MPTPFKRKVLPPVEKLSRNEIVSRLRRELMKSTDVETSACKLASDKGVFCTGFKRYTDAELRERYNWIVRKRPDMTRDQLEQIANDWQLAQQEVHEMPIACDVQAKLNDTCRGWTDFNDEQLAKFYYQLTGKEVVVG